MNNVLTNEQRRLNDQFRAIGLPAVHKMAVQPTMKKNKKGEALYTVTRSWIDKTVNDTVLEVAKRLDQEKSKALEASIERMYVTIFSVAYISARDCFGLGKVRLNRMKKKVDEYMSQLVEIDPNGQRYIKFSDIVNEIEGYGISFDPKEVIAADDYTDQSLRASKVPRMTINSVYELAKVFGEESFCRQFKEYWGEELKVDD